MTRKVTAMFEPHLGRSVTIDQAASLLHVSRRTIYNRIRDGKLQTIRTIGGSQRVLVSSLDESRKSSWTGIKFERSPDDNSQES
jgi:excisionase family DNA binding protein